MKIEVDDNVIVTPNKSNEGYLAGHEFSARVIDIIGHNYLVKDQDDDVFTVSREQLEIDYDGKNMEFEIINDNDGNDTFNVMAKDADEAAHKALKELGWWVAKN